MVDFRWQLFYFEKVGRRGIINSYLDNIVCFLWLWLLLNLEFLSFGGACLPIFFVSVCRFVNLYVCFSYEKKGLADNNNIIIGHCMSCNVPRHNLGESIPGRSPQLGSLGQSQSLGQALCPSLDNQKPLDNQEPCCSHLPLNDTILWWSPSLWQSPFIVLSSHTK